MNSTQNTMGASSTIILEKERTIQEHIDAYNDGLEQLDRNMRKKREEMRMRAFDQSELDEGASQTKRI